MYKSTINKKNRYYKQAQLDLRSRHCFPTLFFSSLLPNWGLEPALSMLEMKPWWQKIVCQVLPTRRKHTEKVTPRGLKKQTGRRIEKRVHGVINCGQKKLKTHTRGMRTCWKAFRTRG